MSVEDKSKSVNEEDEHEGGGGVISHDPFTSFSTSM